MKKLFNSPVIEVKSLSPETEVMGVFSLATSAETATPAGVTVVEDTTTLPENTFDYWTAK